MARLTPRRFVQGAAVALLVAMALTVGLWSVMTGRGPAVEAAVVDGIVQVGEKGRQHQPAVVDLATTGHLLTVFEAHGRDIPHGIYYTKSTDGGANWSEPTLLTTGRSSDAFTCCEAGGVNNPDIARASDGTLWLVYQQNFHGEGFEFSRIYYETGTADGMTWSGVDQDSDVSATPGYNSNPAVVRASQDRIIVAYENQQQGEKEGFRQLVYRYTDDAGKTWQPAADPFFGRLDDAVFGFHDANQPDLAADAGINVIAVFNACRETPGEHVCGIFSRQSTDNGATWADPLLVQNNGHEASIDAGTTAEWVLTWTQDVCPKIEPLGYCEANI